MERDAGRDLDDEHGDHQKVDGDPERWPPPSALDDTDGGTAWLAHYRPDGTPAFARTIAGTAFGRVGEIARVQSRVYVDVTLRGPGNTINGTPIAVAGKDASVWALDLRT